MVTRGVFGWDQAAPSQSVLCARNHTARADKYCRVRAAAQLAEVRVLRCPASTRGVGVLGIRLARAHEGHLAGVALTAELPKGKPQRRVVPVGMDPHRVQHHEAADDPAACHEPCGGLGQLMVVGDRDDSELDVHACDWDRARYAAGLDRDAWR